MATDSTSGLLYGEEIGSRSCRFADVEIFLDSGADSNAVRDWLRSEWDSWADEDGFLASEVLDGGPLDTASPPTPPLEEASWDVVSLEVRSWRSAAASLLFASSPSSFGHGDVLWPAAILVSQALLQPPGALTLGCPLIRDSSSHQPGDGRHLEGLRVVELGAGAGLPSWAACHSGAKVVATDACMPARLLALAFSAALNTGQVSSGGDALTGPMSDCTVCVRGHNWGEGTSAVLEAIGSGSPAGSKACGADIVIVCDCIYNPESHGALLDSCKAIVKHGTGAIIVAFSLHGNAADSSVLGFFDKARTAGFSVRKTQEQQLPPRCSNMPLSRSYVYCYHMHLRGEE